MEIHSGKSQSLGLILTSISVESVVKGHYAFQEVWNPRRGNKFYLQVEEFNCCDCYCNRYTVPIVLDEETLGHVPRDVPKLENYDEIKESLEADNSFAGENYFF